MSDILDLAEMEHDDPEYIPEILPVDARLSMRGPVATIIELFDRAASVSPTKEIIPGTTFALLETFMSSDTEVAHAKITATDGEQTVSVVADGINVLMAGSVLVPGRRILDILKLAPTSMVRIEILGNTATIRSGRAQWTVQTPVGDSLPPLPTGDGIELHNVPRKALLHALTVARKAVATTVARPALMQALIENGYITSCDGGRVHRQTIEGFPKHVSLSIPLKVMDEVAKALKASDSETIQLGSNDYHLVFKIDSDSIIAQRLLIRFPDVETLLLGPAMANQNSLSLDPNELAEVIKRVRVNADPDFAAIFLALTPGKKDDEGHPTWTMAVRARDRLGNASQETMDCQWVGGTKARELCVNHHNLSDFLSSYKSDIAIFKVGEDSKTVRTPLFLEDKTVGFSGVVQQMRVQGFL